MACFSCTAVQEETAFDRVVEYYENVGDPLKLNAAKYLRQYSDSHYGIKRCLVDSLDNPATSLNYKTFKTDTLMLMYLMSNGYSYKEYDSVADKDTITDEYLINNIEMAFNSWNKPWAIDVVFDDFCRYILPYRNIDEELSDWRKKFKDKYEASILDSVEDVTSIREVALYLMRRLKEEVSYSPPIGRTYNNFMTPEEMEHIHYLECRALAHYGTLALRACGVPCATIETHWRFNEVAHTAILLPAVGSNPRPCRLSVYDELLEMGEPKDTMASFRTWRFSYETNPDLVELSSDSEAPSDYYLPVTRMDETPQFSTTYNIALPITEEVKGHRHAFLCRFSHWKWFPIRSGIISNDSVRFKNATIRQWYRLGVYQGDSLYTFGSPFTIVGPQIEDSIKVNINSVDNKYDIIKYDLSGDTVLFKRVYLCKPEENRLTRNMTTFCWDKQNKWHPVSGEAVLWGFNEKTGEYRIFEESMRGPFKPVFHILQAHLPCWTVFFDDDTPRPVGFICKDPVSNEGYLMEF